MNQTQSKAKSLVVKLMTNTTGEELRSLSYLLELIVDDAENVSKEPVLLPSKIAVSFPKKKKPRTGWSKEEEQDLKTIFEEVTGNRTKNLSIEDIRQIMRKRILHRTGNALFAKMYRLKLLPYQRNTTGTFE